MISHDKVGTAQNVYISKASIKGKQYAFSITKDIIHLNENEERTFVKSDVNIGINLYIDTKKYSKLQSIADKKSFFIKNPFLRTKKFGKSKILADIMFTRSSFFKKLLNISGIYTQKIKDITDTDTKESLIYGLLFAALNNLSDLYDDNTLLIDCKRKNNNSKKQRKLVIFDYIIDIDLKSYSHRINLIMDALLDFHELTFGIKDKNKSVEIFLNCIHPNGIEQNCIYEQILNNFETLIFRLLSQDNSNKEPNYGFVTPIVYNEIIKGKDIINNYTSVIIQILEKSFELLQSTEINDQYKESITKSMNKLYKCLNKTMIFAMKGNKLYITQDQKIFSNLLENVKKNGYSDTKTLEELSLYIDNTKKQFDTSQETEGTIENRDCLFIYLKSKCSEHGVSLYDETKEQESSPNTLDADNYNSQFPQQTLSSTPS